MKRLLLLFPLFCFVIACESGKDEEKSLSQNPGTHSVKVVEYMNASSYTYIQVEESGEEYWIAVPQMDVKEGETLYFTKSMEMKDFESPSLKRKFDRILFVEDISRTPDNPQKTIRHPDVRSSKEDVKVESLKDGKTIQAIFAGKENLSGKKIKLRGKVTKFNEGILSRNWIHIQDGTGSEGNYDLVITSNEKAEVGDVIIAEGVVALNKDFGSGYTYEVLLENASIKVETKM